MEHTPGPWQVHEGYIYTADPERALLAQVHNPGSKQTDYPIVENARLMAAAPDLLEALKGLLAKPVGLKPDLGACIAQAEQAIAKARNA